MDVTYSGVLGVDIGIEGTKVVVVDPEGQIVAKAYHSYTFEVPRSCWAEQDPCVSREALRAGLNDLWNSGINSDVAAIGMWDICTHRCC